MGSTKTYSNVLYKLEGPLETDWESGRISNLDEKIAVHMLAINTIELMDPSRRGSSENEALEFEDIVKNISIVSKQYALIPV